MAREESKQKTDIADKRELFKKTPKTKQKPNQKTEAHNNNNKTRKNFALECVDASLSLDHISLSAVIGTPSIWQARSCTH